MKVLKYCTLFKVYNDDYDLKNIKIACVIYPNEGVLLDVMDRVYHVYNNGFKELTVFAGKNVLDFAYAKYVAINELTHRYQILVLTEFEIYGYGRNTLKEFTYESQDYVLEPAKLEIPLYGIVTSNLEKFTKISCVLGHCMASTSRNFIICWGSNTSGQIGNGITSGFEKPYRIHFHKSKQSIHRSLRLTTINENSQIISIACSSCNSYVLFQNGNIYGWGKNVIGEMGLINENLYSVPQLIYSRMKQIVSAGSYALALRYDGVLFGMGDNSFGQIGTGREQYSTPLRSSNIYVSVASWQNLSMGLTNDGQCYIWGEYGSVIIASIRHKVIINEKKYQNNESQTEENRDKKELQKDCHTNLIKTEEPLSNYFEKPSASPPDLVVDSAIHSVPFNDSASNNDQCEDNVHEQDKNIEEEARKKERERFCEILKNGKIEFNSLPLTFKNAIPVKCKSFSKIIAKRFNSTYFNVGSDLDMSNGYYNEDDDNDWIDTSDFIVIITEYEKIVEEEVTTDVNKSTDNIKEDNEKMKEIENRIINLEKEKTTTTINKYHIGDKSNYSVFSKSTFEKVEDIDVSDIQQTGTYTQTSSA